MNNLNFKDIIYIAGFLDGDGSIIAQNVRRLDYKLGFQIRVTVQFTQKTCRHNFLENLQSIIGVKEGPVQTRSPSLSVLLS
jgi:hypothetical protein